MPGERGRLARRLARRLRRPAEGIRAEIVDLQEVAKSFSREKLEKLEKEGT